MLSNAVYNYIATAKGLPFFYVVGDESYTVTLSEFRQQGLIVDHVSDFCPKDDKFPSVDDIIDHFRTLDVDHKQYFISKKFPMRPTFEDDAEIVDAMTEYEAKLRELDVLKKKRSVMQ